MTTGGAMQILEWRHQGLLDTHGPGENTTDTESPHDAMNNNRP